MMWRTKIFTSFTRTFSSHAPKSSQSQPHYKLTYFDIKGLGESIRFQLVLGDANWEDHRIPREKWADYKSKTGWGQLPILHVNGKDTEIIQSGAIGRYLANEFNTLADTPLQRVRCDELVAVLQDVFIEWRLWIRQAAPWVPDKDPKRVFAIQTHVIENVFPHYFGKTNEFITRHGSNGFAVGDKLTWADLVLANLVNIWTSKHGTGIIEKFPKVQEQMETVFSQPKIKEWVKNRPSSFV